MAGVTEAEVRSMLKQLLDVMPGLSWTAASRRSCG